jgi:choline-sulfatase
LRADRVGDATPHIKALARDSIDCRNAWSHVPLTLPSHLSIFTGLLPPEHGVRDNAGYRFDPAHATLASILKANGYHTEGAVSAYVLRVSTGASSGFIDYDDNIGIVSGAPLGSLQRPGEATEKIAEQLIAKNAAAPQFCFLHLYEPHAPYEPTYDADVKRADAIVGTFLDFLKKRGLYDRAVIVLLSDHGEGLLDHGEQEHGVFLYREALQVPLMVKLPRREKRGVIDAPVQLVDVLPTILDAAGIKPPPGLRGISLIRDSAPSRSVYAESLFPRIHLGWSDLRSIVNGSSHFIEAPRAELYDLAHDTRERNDLASTDRRTAAALRDELQRYGSQFTAPETIDPEEAKKLAALGYVSGGADEGGPLPDPKSRIGDLTKLKAINDVRHPANQIAMIEPLLAANPKWSDLRDQLGQAYDATGDHQRAAATYEAGITATPRLAAQFARSAAESLLAARDLAGAEAHARVALAGNAAGAHLLLGEIALARHDLDAAFAEAQAAETESSDRVLALFLLARVASVKGDYAGVLRTVRMLDDARRKNGGSLPERVHYLTADALAHLGRLDDARAQFGEEIASDPHDVQAYGDLALLEFLSGRRDEALRTLTRMAGANPSRETLLFAASSLEKWGERAEAEDFRRRAEKAGRPATP